MQITIFCGQTGIWNTFLICEMGGRNVEQEEFLQGNGGRKQVNLYSASVADNKRRSWTRKVNHNFNLTEISLPRTWEHIILHNTAFIISINGFSATVIGQV